ncbi:serine hydrolase domain-containing protein [Algoriphagus hitonicola]|uniref:CubicO group peptidase, beta-lactamase class C family n=1 Tax=Algoriphagus hitonicola TaxID=435880 RepID=A0A1I2T2Q1_9BACT|nr:serine hydrolase [Algoriphagus hitonicola]SFG59355.1 CubicO group peptidase, beta-lactamase class C family [Algoriphagus hitonicola]
MSKILRLIKSRIQTYFKLLIFIGSFLSFSLSFAQKSIISDLYFPPNSSSEWEKMSLIEAGFDQENIGEFLAWISTTNTRSFIVLKDGKLVIEEHWGNKLTGMGAMNQESFWYWASAGKTLTAALIGIAEQEKILKLNHSSQKYLGKGWTAMSNSQERKIKIIHHLSMTTGLDHQVSNPNSTVSDDLKFKAKPGTRWSYHNAPYTILDRVLESASEMSFADYFKSKIGDPIGMQGFWQKNGRNNVFYSTPRSMARFGLFLLAKGNWNGVQIGSADFFDSMTTPSQNLNSSYGYLTWLNGQNSYMLPGIQQGFEGPLVPSAPSDMYQAMGLNGQFLMVIPSKNLVIIRMGSSPNSTEIPFTLIQDMWDRLAPLILD